MQANRKEMAKKIGAFLLFTALFYALALELYEIAWGTGNRFGEFSLKWGVGFALSLIFLFSLLLLLGLLLWKKNTLEPFFAQIISLRQKLTFLRWILALLLLILPIYFLQYTLWGLVFSGIYFRLFLWLLLTLILGILFTQDEYHLISWHPFLASLLFTSTSFTLASVFSFVSAYPFNLYWSDGNRIWDYSLLFGRRFYNYPADQPIEALISTGRQFVWGIPFLLPHPTIFISRLWSAIVLSLPYALFGWILFRDPKAKKTMWILLGIWTFLFLNQGPIYTPLVLSAILVAIAWGRPLWLAMLLLAISGYYAGATRFTWMFAPAIWAGMLELSGIPLKKDSRLTAKDWKRATAISLAGLSSWYLAPIVKIFSETVSSEGAVAFAGNTAFKQTLLWYRLFPNDTYPEGILGGLLIAILPLIILIVYLLRKKYWKPSFWQKLAIFGSLLVLLIVGLIISTKIGGGNNLHNLDMFLITLIFVAAIAWKNGGRQWVKESENTPLWIKITLFLLIALPTFSSLSNISPNISLSESELLIVKTLTDYDLLTSPPIEKLPSDEEIQKALGYISETAELADVQGEVLFMDLRQLLTFGYVPKIRLVPEYEKKMMMNEAMANNSTYFQPYYEDLANHRFSLIVTEPLKIALKNKEGVFAEESDAWTKWVAAPTLCFYEPLKTFKSVYAQLLVPREEPLDCSTYLP